MLPHSKEKIRLVQHCTAISAIAELLLGLHHVTCVGLSLVINIQQDQYVSESGNTAGIIVLVQPQNLMPFPEDHGILVSPGYETEVSVSTVGTSVSLQC